MDDEILWDLWGDTNPWDEYQEEMSGAGQDVQAASVDDDSYVEDAEPRKRQKTQMKHKGSAQLRSKRMKSLEQGLATVQGQLAQLMQSLRAVAPTCVGAGPAGRRGRIPWPQGATLDESQILRSPGDGDCLWHSVAQALRPQSQPYSVEQGRELEGATSSRMCSEVPLTAKLWGCQEAAVFSAAQEWAENWADARALLTLAYQLNLRIVILNQKEGCVETITTEGPQAGATQTIVLRFTGDHYDTIPEPPLRYLEAIRTATVLTPWVFRTSDLKGGFTRVQRLTGPFRRLDMLRSRKQLRREIPKGRTGTSEDLQPRNSPDVQACRDNLTGPIITWNVARKYDILELLQAYCPLIVALQEVRVAQDHRKGFSHFFAQVGYHVSFAQCADWVPNRGGHMRLDQQIPCVVCLAWAPSSHSSCSGRV